MSSMGIVLVVSFLKLSGMSLFSTSGSRTTICLLLMDKYAGLVKHNVRFIMAVVLRLIFSSCDNLSDVIHTDFD